MAEDFRGASRGFASLEAASAPTPGAGGAGLTLGSESPIQRMRPEEVTGTVHQVRVFGLQDALAGLQEIAFGPDGPAPGALQAQGLRETFGVGLLEGEAGEGCVPVGRNGVRAPAGGALQDRAATLQEDLLQRGPVPETIRSRMPESQTRF